MEDRNMTKSQLTYLERLFDERFDRLMEMQRATNEEVAGLKDSFSELKELMRTYDTDKKTRELTCPYRDFLDDVKTRKWVIERQRKNIHIWYMLIGAIVGALTVVNIFHKLWRG